MNENKFEKENRNWTWVLVNVLTAVLIVRIFYLSWSSQFKEVNFLADPFLVSLLIGCITLQVLRWRILSLDPVNLNFTSSIDLKIAMRKMAKRMYGAIPYLIQPVPSDSILQPYADRIIARDQNVVVTKNIQLMFLLLDLDGLITIHFGAVLLLTFGLIAGGLPSFASALSGIWIAIPILMSAVAGLLIHACATILFLFTFNKHRGR